MNRKHKWSALALLICLALTLGGCSGGGVTSQIVPDPVEETDPTEQYYQTYNEQSEGYFAPDTGVQDAPVVPAPVSLDQIRAAAEQQVALDPDYEQASIYTTIARGDVNIGLVVGEDMNINPLRCPYLDMMNLNTLVYEGLVALDSTMQPVPQLADRWEADGDTWTFTLRSNVYFQDGQLLTPEDVIASWQEIQRNSGSYWYPLVSLIDSITVRDESTIRVKGISGYMMLYAMSFPIVQRQSIEYAQPIGTGPYVIAQYQTSTAVRLEPNPLWWKKSTDQIQSIVGLCYGTAKGAIQAMEMGEIDTLASEYPTASANRNLSDRITHDYSTLTYECIVPNLSNKLLRRFAVRQALMYAIDRSTLANTIYTGMVQESEVPVVPGTWLYEPQAAQYNYNPELALQILYDDGWSDPDGDGVLSKEIDGEIVPLSFKLMTYDRGTTSTRSEAITAIKAQLELVGVKVTTATFKLGEAYDRMNEGDFDLSLCAFELSEIPNLANLFSSTGKQNYSRYKETEMDKLLRTAYDARSADALQSAMSDVQLKIVEDLPMFGLFFRNGVLSSSVPMQGLDAGLRRGYVLRGIANVTLN
ncbi:ABC transporter substrate-binding protein [Eubacteriales bacterium OttesenSCG-928-N13]|nr:ABC transporter substrate-binding protein [Eubacteriales bacterium OttesenSCG-928-N13]